MSKYTREELVEWLRDLQVIRDTDRRAYRPGMYTAAADMLERDGSRLATAKAKRDIADERFLALHSELGELASIEAEDSQLPLDLVDALLRRYAPARKDPTND